MALFENAHALFNVASIFLTRSSVHNSGVLRQPSVRNEMDYIAIILFPDGTFINNAICQDDTCKEFETPVDD